jgi:hypothetical protein
MRHSEGPGKPGGTEINWDTSNGGLHCAHDVNLLGDNINAIKKNIEALIDAGKKVGLQINIERTKYILPRVCVTIDWVWIGDWIY